MSSDECNESRSLQAKNAAKWVFGRKNRCWQPRTSLRKCDVSWLDLGVYPVVLKRKGWWLHRRRSSRQWITPVTLLLLLVRSLRRQATSLLSLQFLEHFLVNFWKLFVEHQLILCFKFPTANLANYHAGISTSLLVHFIAFIRGFLLINQWLFLILIYLDYLYLLSVLLLILGFLFKLG